MFYSMRVRKIGLVRGQIKFKFFIWAIHGFPNLLKFLHCVFKFKRSSRLNCVTVNVTIVGSTPTWENELLFINIFIS